MSRLLSNATPLNLFVLTTTLSLLLINPSSARDGCPSATDVHVVLIKNAASTDIDDALGKSQNLFKSPTGEWLAPLKKNTSSYGGDHKGVFDMVVEKPVRQRYFLKNIGKDQNTAIQEYRANLAMYRMGYALEPHLVLKDGDYFLINQKLPGFNILEVRKISEDPNIAAKVALCLGLPQNTESAVVKTRAMAALLEDEELWTRLYAMADTLDASGYTIPDFQWMVQPKVGNMPLNVWPIDMTYIRLRDPLQSKTSMRDLVNLRRESLRRGL